MNATEIAVDFRSASQKWQFAGAGAWRQDRDGCIYPPVWSLPSFDSDPDKMPDPYAHDLTREDYAFLTGHVLADLDIRVEFKNPYGAVIHGGVVFRAQDARRCYVVDIHDIYAKRMCAYELSLWIQREDGIRTFLARGTAPHSIVPQRIAERGPRTREEWARSSPDWIKVRVQASGTYIRVSVDGRITFEVRDRTYAAGYVGLVGRGAVYFRDLSVSGAEAGSGKAESDTPFPPAGAGDRAPARAIPAIDGDGSGGGAGPLPAAPGAADRPQFFFPGSEQPAGFNAYPAACRTAKGGLVLVWGHTSIDADPTVPRQVLVTQSADDGMTWTRPCCIFTSGGPKAVPTALLAHHDGTLSCFIHVWPDGDEPACTLVVRSAAGTGWSAAETFVAGGRELPDNCGLCSPAVRLAGGTVLLCGYQYRTFPGGDPDHFADREDRSLLLRSTDDGYTWAAPQLMCGPGYGNVECNVVELEPGKLIALMVNQHDPGLLRAVSTDDGCSWSTPDRVELTADCLCALRDRSGALLLAHRGFGIFVHVSCDEGLTWSAPSRLSPTSGIMAMLDVGDGRILGLYNEGYRVPGHIRGQFFRIEPHGNIAVAPA